MTGNSGTAFQSIRRTVADLAALPIHPVLFFLYPVVSLLAWNIQELYASQAFRSLAATLGGCLVLWGLLALLTRDLRRAAILTTVAGLLFFSYGHVYDALGGLRDAGFPLARHRFLLPAWAAAFLAVSAIIIRTRPSGRSFTTILNVIGLTVLLLPLISLAIQFSRVHADGEARATRIPTVLLQPPADGPAPDIYYIILDGYARADTMRQIIGLDNSEFLGYLESQGFYVASESRSNHNWTSLSLASSLNLTLAQHLGANMLPGYYPTPFVDYIRNSLVSRSLQEIGYRTIGLQSGYLPTEWIDADLYLAPASQSLPVHSEEFPLNAFESMLLDTTVLQPLLGQGLHPLDNTPFRAGNYPSDVLRAIITAQFDHLSQPLPLDRPRFVFAHIVAPHRPYLFTATGEAREIGETFTLIEEEDASEDSLALYRDQAAFITLRTQQVVRSILANSEVPPIIILQADHGPGLGLGEDERTGILNAILIRQDCRSMLSPGLTPVNTFRVVFNCYFGSDLPLVADEVYWSKWPRGAAYEFVLLGPEEGQP